MRSEEVLSLLGERRVHRWLTTRGPLVGLASMGPRHCEEIVAHAQPERPLCPVGPDRTQVDLMILWIVDLLSRSVFA
jgi:hypothetical protein